MLTRRHLLAAAFAAPAFGRACATDVANDGAVDAPGQAARPAATTRPNILAIDRERILRKAGETLALPSAPQPASSPEFLAFSLLLPALAAAALVEPAKADQYRTRAAEQLHAWFVAEATRLDPAPDLKAFEPIADRAALGEMCVALPFLGLDAAVLDPVKAWSAKYLDWLTSNRTALLARDSRDHHGSSWLLQAAAAARLTGNDTVLGECRHRFKTVTIRAQINAEGLFPHELTTPDPYRNSLFNLDLLAGASQLLSTQFESVWDHELQDGPGMHAAVARHAFYIKDRVKWPYPADSSHFKELPCRRPALAFAGRAYSDPEYISIWRSLDPDPASPEILHAFPIRQPALWMPQPHLPAAQPNV